ncbi:NADPH:quinone reductase-like Zn-dependent oxidoreductase [Microbacterium natoriense]|uniref:NADPH:quinone reductase-like Zn-dependent oxidoreductase n=1 Tax=Microbacterium natoriense TaxID=284570 RepID=A0AAW8EXG0_9MICO|nr:NAD(P)-dependent alcohol dehydrogenase [Microbacterium natoriense]MDQ0647057.1 NADPH:quinone reductase-like Zn-dependent oxidoreductase [Microbacterium natoriense]
MTTDTTMTAAVYRRFGGPEQVHLEQRPTPSPRPGEVLIRVHASTVSIADHRSRARDIPAGLGLLAAAGLGVFRPKHPILGMDAAGVVEAVGSGVTAFTAGDRVIAAMGGAFGGHAEYVCVPADGAITRAPASMTLEEAVTLVFGGITALGFFGQITIGPGTSVLVNGASGAVGTAAIQLAKHLGADVTAVTSEGNASLVTSLGADRVVDYTRQDFAAGGGTYDVIVDCVGNAPFSRVQASINPGGALLLVISDLWSMLRSRGQSRRSGKLVTWNVGTPGADELAHLVSLADAGRFQAVIDRSFDLADIVEAHRYVDTGRKRGNVVLVTRR